MPINNTWINQMRSYLENPGNAMRGNFYFSLAREYSLAGTHISELSASQALMHAQISTYSGDFGAAAIIGNYNAKEMAPNIYTISLDQFSLAIATRLLDAIEWEIDHGFDGILTPEEMHVLDYSVWRELGLGAYFPGNMLRWRDYNRPDDPIAANSVVYQPGVYASHRYSSDTSYTITPDSANDNLWHPDDLGAFGDDFSAMLRNVGLFHETFGKRPSDFGFNERSIIENGPQISADGVYRAYADTIFVRTADNKLEEHTIVHVVHRASEEEVVIIDTEGSIFEGMGWFDKALGGIGSSWMQTAPSFGGDYVDPSAQLQWEELLGRTEDGVKNWLGADLDSGSRRHGPGAAVWTPASQHNWLCFGAGTPVLTPGNMGVAIEKLRVGDLVLAFDGRGALQACAVTEVHRTSADSLVELADGLLATPSHPFLCEDGTYRPVWEMVQKGIPAVVADGSVRKLIGKQLSGDSLARVGGKLDAATNTWHVDTFNLTVERLHTYIAGGYRVHNTSLPNQVPPGFMVLPTSLGADGLQVTSGFNPLDGSIGVFAGRDLNGDGNTELVYAEIRHRYYTRQMFTEQNSRGLVSERRDFYDRLSNGTFQHQTVVVTSSIATITMVREQTGVSSDGVVQWRTIADTVELNGFPIDVGTIGSILGSQIGRMLSDDPFVSAAGGVLVGAIGENLFEAATMSVVSDKPLSRAFDAAFEDFGTDLRNAAVGAISSYLAGELVEALGLEGTAGGIATTASGAVIGQIATNLGRLGDVVLGADGLPTGATYQWNTGISLNLIGTAVAGYLGQLLASKLVQFDTIAGQIGAALGGSIGAIAGAKIGVKTGFSVGGPIGAFIGAFIGYIVGGIIGTFFGEAPRAGSDLVWRESSSKFVIGSTWAHNGASGEGARNIARGAADMINSIVEATGARVVDGAHIRAGSYGYIGKDFVYRIANAETGKMMVALRVREVDLVMRFGAMIAVADLLPRLVGGDVFVKRALISSFSSMGIDPNAIPITEHKGLGGFRSQRPVDTGPVDLAKSFDMSAVFGNIQTALQYTEYLQNAASIRAMMATEPDSAFTAGWIITLARVMELGLHKRSELDWTGGWTLFLDEKFDDAVNGIGFTAGNLQVAFDPLTNQRLFGFLNGDGAFIGGVLDTIDSQDKDSIVGTSGADSIVVVGDRLASTAGLTVNDAAGSAAQFVIDVAARIDGGEGNDTIVAGALGNDLIGGGGNDTLVGGKLDDWLFGDSGNDRLFAGTPANYQFSDSDAAAVAAAISVKSGGGDMLDGGDGDDLLYGSAGSDWLRGGDGTDLLLGGAGGDILEGGAGNDRGASGEARLLGGAGTDQYVFSYGDGWDTIFDEADIAASPGATGDSLYARLQGIVSGTVQADWAGNGSYELDGSVRGGEDAISFGAGIGMEDLVLQRSGTEAAPGQDLIIKLTYLNPSSGLREETGDRLEIRDWFDSARRVEWLRFADGQELRIGDMASFIVGTSGSDIIVGTHGADFMVGGSGNDSLFGLLGDDFGFGGEGNDLVAGDEDNDLVSGGSGNDNVIGGEGNDTVFGDAGNDRLSGGAGSDLLAGGRGSDEVVGGEGDDIFMFNRGDGRDRLLDSYVDNWELVWNGEYTNGYVFDSASGTVSKNGEVLFDGATWSGLYDYSDATKTLRRHLGAVDGTLGANSGQDYLQFGAGIDIQDLMLRSSGADLEIAITASEGAELAFDDTADRITIADWYTTGNSIENFVFVATGIHYIADANLIGTATDASDALAGTSSVDWITGNGGDDTISGDDGDDLLAGNAGRDVLHGDAGNDVLYGGTGDDTLDGGAGSDVLVGGLGVDLASYASGTTAVRAFLEADISNSGGAKGDRYFGIDGLEGGSAADKLGGSSSGDVLRGLGGNDILLGGAGDDVYEIETSNGQDTIDDRPFVTEEIVSGGGALNTALYTATWTHLGLMSTANGTRRCFRLVVTRNGTGEEVYRSRDTIDYTYTIGTSPSLAMPAPSAWVAGASQWLPAANVTRTLNGVHPDATGSQVVREIFRSGDGGLDTLQFGVGIGLSDLTFSRPTATDLRIQYAGGNHVTLVGQTDLNRAVEQLALRDGVTADLTRLVLVGETASAAGDLVVGDQTANTLEGLDGDDVISGAAGADTLRGGGGDDLLEGAADADTLDGGTDSVTDGRAVDPANPMAYGDTIRYVRSNAAVSVNLATLAVSGGHATGDVIVAVNGVSTIENVVGSDGFGDMLRGDARANRLAGLGGDDTIEGDAGNDLLVGGSGNDTLRGGDDDDNISGDVGDDILEGGNDQDILAGGEGADSLSGDAGDDLLAGGEGDDTLRGGDDDDNLMGDVGDDLLYGDAGNDELVGDQGDDQLFGGDGDDRMVGWSGDDTLSGDAGDDLYLFDADSGSDTIVDAAGVNRIEFGDVDYAQLWLTRVNDDLRIGVIGGSTTITVQGFYAAASPTRVASIRAGEFSLELARATALVQAMTSSSAGTTPAALPEALREQVNANWLGAVNARPTDIYADRVLSFNENYAPNTGLAWMQTSDADSGDTALYELLDSAGGRYTLRSDGLLSTGPTNIDYEQASNNTITIRVTDSGGLSYTETITVGVQNVNEAATSLDADRTLSFSENLVPNTSLAWFSAGDPEGDVTSYSLVDSAGGRYTMASTGLLSTGLTPIDYEQASSHTIIVRATDAGGLTYDRAFTVGVQNVNEAPTSLVADRALSFSENLAPNTALAWFSAGDPEGNVSSYSLLDSAGGRYTMASNGLLSTGATNTDYEQTSSHTIIVRATDAGGLTYDRAFTVGVQNANEAPTSLNADRTLSFSENLAPNTALAWFSAGDPEGNVSSYSLLDSASGRYTMSSNGLLSTGSTNIDYEQASAHIIIVRATDAGGLTYDRAFTVGVQNANEAPTAINATGLVSSIAERDRPILGSSSPALVLASLSVTDPDAGDPGDFNSHVYSVDDSRFEVVSDQLRLRAGVALDYETATSVAVTVTATDRNGAGLSVARTFTFAVMNADDYFYGTSGNDTITGTAGTNLIYGNGGDDTLNGAGDNDLLDGGDGNDTLNGLGGIDTLYGQIGDDNLDGGAGADTLRGGDGVDTLRGGDGDDFMYGDSGNDTLQGGSGADTLEGGDHNDTLEGQDGNDTLRGQGGDDVLIGGAGADRFNGGAGVDVLSYANATSGVTLSLAAGTGTGGDAAGDVLEDAIEHIVGSAFADTITGSAGSETLVGGAGNDTIYGGAGHDLLIGGEGDDTLDAQAGNDTLDGGAGSDILIGGDDSDVYRMDADSGNDEIRNFDPNGTDIDVVGYQGISNRHLWFERGGNDLIVTAVGTSTRTTIKDWYVITTATDRSNYKIDFFFAGAWTAQTINAEALVNLMAGDTRPTTTAAYDALHANASFEGGWAVGWNLNQAPTMASIATQTINEDGSLSLELTIGDDYTPGTGLTVTAQAVNPSNYNVADSSLVNAPSLTIDGAGNRTLSVTALANRSGQTAIRVTATDPGGLSTSQVFLLNVTPIADTPSISGPTVPVPTAPAIKRTFDGGALALNLDAWLNDTDGSETLEIRIANVPGGITFSAGSNLGSGVWSFTRAQLAGLMLQGPAGWSQDLSLNVSATSREVANGATATNTAPVLNLEINARPTDIYPDRVLSFNENYPLQSGIAWMQRSDADSDDTAYYELLDSAGGRYTLRSDGLLSTGTTNIDYEQASSNTIVVRVTDSGGLSYTETISVGVINVNEAPTNISADRALSFNENYAPNTGLAWFSGSDPEGNITSYSLLDSAGGRYTLRSDGLLSTGSTLIDYEQASSHTIIVRATDAGGLTYDRAFTVGVQNVNEAPTQISADRALSFNENYASNTSLAWFSGSDPEGNITSYSLLDSAGGRYTLRSDGLLSTGSTLIDYEQATSHTIIVRATDAGGLTYDRAFAVGVQNVNEAPTSLNADRALSFNENYAPNTGLAWFSGSDPDGNITSYSLLDSAGGRYTLRSDGLLSTGSTLIDYEQATSHTIIVRASDAGGLTYDRTFTIGVVNVNEAPTNLYPDRLLSFNEGYANGTGLAWFDRTDPEGDGATFSLLNDAGGRYTMTTSGNRGLLMAGPTPTDYESGSTTHTIVVRVTDSGGLYYDRTLNVGVMNVNEAPTITSSAFSVPETNPSAGNYLMQTGGGYARVEATDPEGATLRYQLVGGDTSTFNIDADGYLHLQRVLNYEGTRNYSVVVRGWDGGAIGSGNAVDRTISIAVTDVNEAPVITGWTPDLNGNNYFIGTVNAYDPEGGALTYSVQSYWMMLMRDYEYGSMLYEWEEAWSADVTANSAGGVSMVSWFPFGTMGPGWEWYREWGAQYGVFTVKARDANGNESTPMSVRFIAASSYVLPVVFDLDGDGVELLSKEESNVAFAVSDTGPTLRTGWVGADDGLLALDRDGDGLITRGAEISFVQDLPEASSDLEGLAAFDTNGNLTLDAGDERFADFLVWQDRNQDGVSQQDELLSLNEAGIHSLSLLRTLEENPLDAGGNLISATTDYIRLDGTRGVAGDVALGYDSLRFEVMDADAQQELPADEVSEDADITAVDRGSDSPSPLGRVLRDQSPDPLVTDEPQGSAIQAAPPSPEPQAQRPWRDTRWGRPDYGLAKGGLEASDGDTDESTGEWQPEARAARSALHASLDTATRRRLQMIDAMAGFAPESAAELALQPHRRVDSRTLELLTSVSRQGSMAS